jgi:hypothetical protein
MMDAKLTKSLTDLIDETLQELEELRKSRFAAAEIKIEGPGDGIAGKPSDGDLHAKKGENEAVKAEDKKEDDEDEDKKKKDMEEAKKGQNEDPRAEDMDKKEDKKEDKKDDKEPHKDDPEHEAKEKKMAQKLMDMHKDEMKKSYEEQSTFFKSHVEERVKPLEDKLATILELVNKIAEQPVAPKGAPAGATPLFKSDSEGGEPLSKAEVAGKLFELKKSGTRVDSLDITKAEMGQDLASIIKKYEIS